MRVALNAWFWDHPSTGSGQYTRKLTEGVASLGVDVQHVTSPLATARPEIGTGAASTLRDLLSSIGKVWFEQITFPRSSRRLGSDVAHVPYWAPPLVSAVPTIVTIHDLIPLLLPEYRGGLLVRLYTSLVTLTARRARMILTDSEASRQDILEHLPVAEEYVRAIPLAADKRYHAAAAPGDDSARARYDLPERYILYLGGFDVRKNVITALRAYCLAGRMLGSTCPLVISGHLPKQDTAFSPDPRCQAREVGLDPDWVSFAGPAREEDKPALYRGAVAFLFPSKYEGFGLPPLEAMACGTPVIGSNASCLPEVVGDGGILLAPQDAEGMARALVEIAHDANLRNQLARNAVARAAHYSWERTARETLDAYQQALAADTMTATRP